jgi:hypothetical protein
MARKKANRPVDNAKRLAELEALGDNISAPQKRQRDVLRTFAISNRQPVSADQKGLAR